MQREEQPSARERNDQRGDSRRKKPSEEIRFHEAQLPSSVGYEAAGPTRHVVATYAPQVNSPQLQRSLAIPVGDALGATPQADGRPYEEKSQDRKDNDSDEGTATADASAREEACHEEQANSVEGKEGAEAASNDCECLTHESLLGNELCRLAQRS
jgi:hypothetical protein